jgi:hypothetical protein
MSRVARASLCRIQWGRGCGPEGSFTKDLCHIRLILLDLEQQLLFIASGNTPPLTGPGCTTFVPNPINIGLGN